MNSNVNMYYFRYRDRRDYYNRYEEDSYYRDGRYIITEEVIYILKISSLLPKFSLFVARNSRPSSRSGSEYRRDFVDYGNQRYCNPPPYYELRKLKVQLRKNYEN